MSEVQYQQSAQTNAVKRAAPMLRSAKVVCLAGEYVCLVRDVSEDGLLLSFLHDVPPEPRIILVLANGQTYPIQRIWAGEGQAGYRFAGSMVMDEFLHESAPFQLRPVRLTINASARLIDGVASHVAELRDLSTHGASFECGARFSPGRLISVQVNGLAPSLAQVVWSKELDEASESSDASDANAANAPARLGVQFQLPLTLRDLAAASIKLQPFAPKAVSTQTASASIAHPSAA